MQPGDADYLSSAQLGSPGNNLGALPIDAKVPISIAMIASGGFANLVLTTPPTSQSSAALDYGTGYVTFAGKAPILTLPGEVVFNTGTIIVPDNVAATVRANYC